MSNLTPNKLIANYIHNNGEIYRYMRDSYKFLHNKNVFAKLRTGCPRIPELHFIINCMNDPSKIAWLNSMDRYINDNSLELSSIIHNEIKKHHEEESDDYYRFYCFLDVVMRRTNTLSQVAENLLLGKEELRSSILKDINTYFSNCVECRCNYEYRNCHMYKDVYTSGYPCRCKPWKKTNTTYYCVICFESSVYICDCRSIDY